MGARTVTAETRRPVVSGGVVVPRASLVARGLHAPATTVAIVATVRSRMLLMTTFSTREVEVVARARVLHGQAPTWVRLGTQERRVVTVPREAVSAEGFVLVMENGRTALRPVTVGGDVGGGRVEVVSGLASGERVARTAAVTR